MAVRILIDKRGPLFDGRARVAIKDYLRAAVVAVADEGENMVHARLGQVLKHPTGHYASTVVTDRVTPDLSMVSDHGVIYGPWLEGTSSRNQSTRFKGYHTFRRTRLALGRRVRPIATPILARFIGRMN